MPPPFQHVSLKKFETKRTNVNICDEHFSYRNLATVIETIILDTQTVTRKYHVKANML